jgi:hypothetical protein
MIRSPHVCILGKPSEELAEKIAAEEEARYRYVK